jgi:hypothetical protein
VWFLPRSVPNFAPKHYAITQWSRVTINSQMILPKSPATVSQLLNQYRTCVVTNRYGFHRLKWTKEHFSKCHIFHLKRKRHIFKNSTVSQLATYGTVSSFAGNKEWQHKARRQRPISSRASPFTKESSSRREGEDWKFYVSPDVSVNITNISIYADSWPRDPSYMSINHSTNKSTNQTLDACPSIQKISDLTVTRRVCNCAMRTCTPLSKLSSFKISFFYTKESLIRW